MQIMSILTLLIRVYVGGYFLYAAVPKIDTPLAFATSIAHYGLVPDFAVNAMALILPWLELLAGVGLLVGFRTRTSAAICGVLLAMFTTAVAWAVIMNLNIDCGCFGDAGGETVSWMKVFTNTLMIAGMVFVFFNPRSPLSLDNLRDADNG